MLVISYVQSTLCGMKGMTQTSQTHLYRDSLLIENNNSDVSDIDPEDLASIVQVGLMLGIDC